MIGVWEAANAPKKGSLWFGFIPDASFAKTWRQHEYPRLIKLTSLKINVSFTQLFLTCEVLKNQGPTSSSHLRTGQGFRIPDKGSSYFAGNGPKYWNCRLWFDRLFRRKRFEYDNVFDWMIREFESLRDCLM
jgi:hypothetical protein